jgi:hypothetical protein
VLKGALFRCRKASPKRRKEKVFFFEKKKQKTFDSPPAHLSGHGPDLDAGADLKVFCFFFSKKKCLLEYFPYCVLSLRLNSPQMILAAEALRINLVDILGA